MCDSECKCDSNLENKTLLIGGIIAYELAIIITILIFIYMDLDTPVCETETNLETEAAVE